MRRCKRRSFDFENFEITKREILASISIVAVMLLIGILYAIKPDGERVEINRYFREGEKDFIEIASCEYEMRRKMYHELLENLKKEKNSNESE